MSEKEKEAVGISIPLITEDEIIKIDNNLDDIINQFTQQFVHNKDLAIAQHIIQKQQTEYKDLKLKYEQNLKFLKHFRKELQSKIE